MRPHIGIHQSHSLTRFEDNTITFSDKLRFLGKLPTYPSPKPTLLLTSHLGQNVGLWGGGGGRWAVSRKPKLNHITFLAGQVTFKAYLSNG